MGQLQQQTTSFEAFAHNTMMKTETIALLMAALLALSAVTHPVMAQDRDDPDADRDADEADRDDDTDEDTDETDFRDAERKLEVEHSNDEIKVESKREDNTSEDKLVVKAYVEDGKDFRLRLKYETETETGDVETSAEAKMRLRFSEIIEFVGHCLGPGDRPVGEPAVGRFRCRLALPRRCAERRPCGRLCHVEVGVKGNARGCGLERTTLRHKQGLGRGGGWKRDGRRWGGL